MSKALAVTDKKKLSPKQLQVLALLVAGHTNEGAAELATVPLSTIQGWLKNSAFNEEYRLGMERFRMILESRVVALGQKATKKLSEFIDHQNPEVSLEASKVTLNAAVRLSNRYKELQVQGFIAPAQPLVVFPVGTQLPWAAKPALPELPEAPTDIIDVDAEDVSDSDTNDDDDSD